MRFPAESVVALATTLLILVIVEVQLCDVQRTCSDMLAVKIMPVAANASHWEVIGEGRAVYPRPLVSLITWEQRFYAHVSLSDSVTLMRP